MSLDFDYRFNQTGFYPFRVEVTVPGIKERSLNNNSYPGAIEVLTNKQRVVILSESPSWDNKFIVDAATENPRWEVKYYRFRVIKYLLEKSWLIPYPQTIYLPSSFLIMVLYNFRDIH